MLLRELSYGKNTDKDTVHSYLDTYERLFVSRKDASNVLEVGVYFGGSIELWHDYFQNAIITGIDINTTSVKYNERVRLFTGNAYTTDMIAQLSDRQYDIIIDDGPHTLDSMIYIAKNYTNLLTENGVLIIEDIQDESWVPVIIASFPEKHRSKVKFIDLRGNKLRYDDMLIVLDLSQP